MSAPVDAPGRTAGPGSTPSASELTVATARFCRLLRRRGVPVTVAESVVAVRGLDHLDLSDRREVYLGLRSLLTASVRDYPVFHRAFDEFWRWVGGAEAAEEGRIPGPRATAPEPPPRRRTVSLKAWLAGEGADADDPEEAESIPGASARESLAKRDFGSVGEDELEEVMRAVRRLARRVARRRGRRWRADRRGTRVHLRRTVRRSLATGGELPELVFRSRRPRRTRIVALCDVSGSMSLYSRFLLQFLYALQHEFSRVESFVFSTRLTRVTGALSSARYRDALSRVGERAPDFSGGTRIGESVEAFVEEWPGLLDRRTTVLILSDGWETGDPERLSRALEAVAERARRSLWLNPLAGSEDFRPVTRGMRAVLPRVDAVVPVHNLESLEALGRHLT